MAETIQEFLVSVKYAVDASSQNNFLSALKKAAGTVSGVAAEIGGLSAAIFVMARSLADVGEKFYFMSNRLGSGVNEIKNATFAMTQFGMSASEAEGAMERFGDWTRSMGPAATGYLRSLGVTARDTVGQLRQLGPILKAMGGTAANAQGTDAQRLAFAHARMVAEQLGINEKTMMSLTSGQFQQDDDRAGVIGQMIWGTKTKQETEKAEQKWANQSHELMRGFREMGLIFTGVKTKFSQGLFDNVLPRLKEFNELMLRNMPTITRIMDGVTKALGGFLELVGLATKTFLELPGAIQIALAAFTAWGPAMALMRSPLAWILAGLAALLLLLDDYKGFQEGKDSYFDWSKFDKMAESFSWIGDAAKWMWSWVEALDAVIAKFTGVDNVAKIFAATLLMIGMRFIAIRALSLGASLFSGAFKTLWEHMRGTKGTPPAEVPGVGTPRGAPPAEAPAGKPGILGSTPKSGLLKGGIVGIIASVVGDWLVDKGSRALLGDKATDQYNAGTDALSQEGWSEFKKFWKSITAWPTDEPPGGPQKLSMDDSDARQLGLEIARGMSQFAQNAGDFAKQFAGPGAPEFGYQGEDVHPAGGGWAGQALTGGGGGGGGPGDPDAGGGADTSNMEFSAPQWDAFRNVLGKRESGNRYNIKGGSSGRFSGKYQFGAVEIAETAKQLGEQAPSREQFLNDPAMQERFLQQYTLMHHRQLMKNPKYAAMGPAERAGALMAAHLLGVGGANKVLAGDKRGADAFGTTGANYFNEGRKAVAAAPLGGTPMAAAPSLPAVPPIAAGAPTQPLGSQPMPGQQPQAGGEGFGKAVSQTNTTHISVAPGPDAAATANKVAEAQTRVNERQARHLQGAYT